MGIFARELFQVVKNTYIFLVGLLDKKKRGKMIDRGEKEERKKNRQI